jgi:hypothetical protein
MNALVRASLLSAAILCAVSGSASAQAPKLDAARATRLATDYLATLGPSAPHIVSVQLEKSALLNGSLSWIIHWSEPVNDNGNREIGVRIKMDGTMAYLVENLEGRKKRAASRPMLR